MSPAEEYEASIVAGRREDARTEPRRCPDPRGQIETMLYVRGGGEDHVPRARDSAQHEINESRPPPVSVLTQFWRFFSGEPSSGHPVREAEEKTDVDSDVWTTVSLDSPSNQGEYETQQPSHFSDRRGNATRLDESQIQEYWSSPFLPESQVPPAPAPLHWPFDDEDDPFDDVEAEAIEENHNLTVGHVASKTVQIVDGDERQAVQPQAATIVDPSLDSSSALGTLVASARTSSADLTAGPQDEADEEEQGCVDQEEDIVVQSMQMTRVGRATLVNMPQRSQNQTEGMGEEHAPSGDLADGLVEQDDSRRSVSITLGLGEL
ncbi:hypothetical protein ACLX1H_002603 [Fusarium chlamydosporum]